MGADGGVSWVKTSEPEKLLDLIAPFHIANFDKRDENHDWVEENAQDGCIYGTYGPAQPIAMDNLQEIARFVIEDPNWHDFTFEEVLLDIKTRPFGYLSKFDKMVLEATTLPDQNVLVWAKQVNELIEGYGSEETWT